MNFTILVLIALILGFIVGRLVNIDFGNMYEIMLYIQILLIGIDLGKSSGLRGVRKVGKFGFLLPLFTIIGSLIGGVVAFLVLDIPLKYALAISSGMGWYSLCGPILAKYSAVYGVMGFLVNLAREIFTIIGYSFIIKKFPKDMAIAIGGGTTMDSTLPIIVKFGGKDIMILSFVHGFILTLLIPFIIPFILMLPI
ncbi:protein of unknown function DUF340 membrane [Methanococcus vannielii SB]|uniref:Lysine exporter LysO family protein n=1 Tax=Methanococcus vannielii (strain ATCC 35089 / DSM 1224 / JCM 13029 / OCM 148 / SB) TaxID=406327 RepID=A6UP11_METVS|nr:lysine exporter LysO family protein [Methanococcus vannielii]ABR54233.1 protein of unknown function DUF340 membrane [Methanococcus vannielii SB]